MSNNKISQQHNEEMTSCIYQLHFFHPSFSSAHWQLQQVLPRVTNGWHEVPAGGIFLCMRSFRITFTHVVATHKQFLASRLVSQLAIYLHIMIREKASQLLSFKPDSIAHQPFLFIWKTCDLGATRRQATFKPVWMSQIYRRLVSQLSFFIPNHRLAGFFSFLSYTEM